MDYFHHGTNDGRIYQQAVDIARAEGATRRVKEEALQLRRTVDRMRLATAAMWELVRDQHGLSDDDLLDKIHEIDERDGSLDGRIKEAPRACPDCARTNRASREACLYCGAALRPASPI